MSSHLVIIVPSTLLLILSAPVSPEWLKNSDQRSVNCLFISGILRRNDFFTKFEVGKIYGSVRILTHDPDVHAKVLEVSEDSVTFQFSDGTTETAAKVKVDSRLGSYEMANVAGVEMSSGMGK